MEAIFCHQGAGFFFKGFHRFFVKKDAWEGIAEQGGLWKRRQRGDSVEEDAEKVNPR